MHWKMIRFTKETGQELNASPHPDTGHIRVSLFDGRRWGFVFIPPTAAADWAEGLLKMAEEQEATV